MSGSTEPRMSLTAALRRARVATVVVMATGCHSRTVIEPYGYCGPYRPSDAAPSSVLFARGTAGELRVIGGDVLGKPIPISYRIDGRYRYRDARRGRE